MTTGFVDEAVIRVRAGDGGDGSASFHREKYRPKGGPDGGDGGRGGSVVLVADAGADTLAVFRTRSMYRAPAGGKGGSNTKRGADADDLRITVPPGTVVFDRTSGEMLADLAADGASFVVARGGRGGRGNASISSAADRAPGFAERGEPGEEREVALELRVVADAGFIGLPNAGKSTLLRAISAARPKVGEYPFTTLQPHLGVVERGERRVVAADLPGLIEGAAEGRGLGVRFLRHAERCAVLAAVTDLASEDPVADLRTVYEEVESYDTGLSARVRIVVGNKIDLRAEDAGVRAWAEEIGADYRAVSALTGDGIEDLVALLLDTVEAARAQLPPAESFAVFRPVAEDRIVVEREGDGFRVRSSRVERYVAMTPMGNPRAVRHLQRRLHAMGVERALEREGAVEGDEVFIGSMTFEFHPEPERSR